MRAPATSTADERFAKSSVIARDVSLPTSSSETSNTLPDRGSCPFHSCSPRIAHIISAMPDFISSTPGPHSRPLPRRHGMVVSVPSGYTVS